MRISDWSSDVCSSDLLHLEIVQERLEREFSLDLVTTAPSVVYKIHMTNGRMIELHNPADMPEVVKIDHIEEPWISATSLVTDENLGPIMKRCEERRGAEVDLPCPRSWHLLVHRLPLTRGG